ncbi:MAG TPA: hypothetical protein VGV40_09380 [Solirubrobacteraceae bacterium]|nr:hypothetical protein [Solirubrobacteraceae bacterium]
MIAEVAAVLRAEGGPIAAALDEGWPPPSGPAGGGLDADRAFAVAAVREGYLLHYGAPEVVREADAGLALLAGDRLYALGLARLAAVGDLEAVRALADLISECARSHAEGDRPGAERAWEAARASLGMSNAPSR